VLAALLTVPPAHAQGRIGNAVTDTRSAAQGLDPEMRRAAARAGGAWIGYRVPMVAGPRRICCSDSFADSACRLNGGSGVTMAVGDSDAIAGSTRRITIEPPADMLIFARVDAGQVVRLRTFTPDCDIDAGGAPLVWLNDVKPPESVAWLATLVSATLDSEARRDRVVRPALAAIALHETPESVSFLIQFARTSQDNDVRRQAIFWLGRSHDSRAVTFFEEILLSK
jgi:hypothetical protein